MSEPTSPFPATLDWDQQPQPSVWVIPRPRQRWWLYVLFLLLTLFSTTVVGGRMELHYLHNQPLFLPDEDFLSPFVTWIAHPSEIGRAHV